jgi:hypothetical protein
LYQHDAVGNRTADADNHLDASHLRVRRCQLHDEAGGITYTWDNNGNLTNDGGALYRYDQVNRLIAPLSGATSLFNYNGNRQTSTDACRPFAAFSNASLA